MKRFLATLGLVAFLWSGLAHAVPRYLVEDSSNVIKAYTEDDALLAPPGHTAVAVSVIEAVYTGTIYQGGTWIVTGGVGVYTPPDGIVEPIDRHHGQSAGCRQSCSNMLDVFDAGARIHPSQPLCLDRSIARTKAIEGIHWQIVNSARVALNATRTHARRQKFCEESASWPDATNGDVRAVCGWVCQRAIGVNLPTKDWSWVDPQADPYTRRTP